MPPPKSDFVAHVAERRATLRAQLATLLPSAGAIVLEIGSGHGHFLVRYAQEYPDKLCCGVDFCAERVERAQRKAARAGLANCHFVRAEARELIESLPAGVTLREIWVLFPDPWPKKRHHKHRILQGEFFDFLATRAGPSARLYFRTDHLEYFQFVAGLLPALTTWRRDEAALWPLEHETVFQARAPAYQSLAVVRPADPARPTGTAG